MEKYGIEWQKGVNELTQELYCFQTNRTEEQGGLGRYGHARNSIDLIWNNSNKPSARRFLWSPWAEDMIYEMCNNSYLSIAGCASSGKSDAAAVYGILNYMAAPHHTLVMMTSTTLREAKRRIWKSVEELWNAVPGGLPGKLVSSLGQIKGLNSQGGFSEGSGIVLVPAERRKEKEAIGKLVGIKQRRVILIADELPELPESLVHAAQTNLATNPFFQMIALGNPNSHFDAFGMFSEPKGGWSTVTEADMEWETRRGRCIRFDASDNPNLTHPDKPYFWMPRQETIDQAKEDYGDNSLMFYRMYKGFWCPAGLDSGIYSEADLIKSNADRLSRFDHPGGVGCAGLDPSFTSGGDRTIAYFGTFGKEDGVPVLQFDGHVTLKENIRDKKTPRSIQIARAFRAECVARGISPEFTGIDSTGAGGPMLDILHMEWSDKVYGVNFAGKASDRPVSATDPTPSTDRYYNRMSELWYQGKELLRSNQLTNLPPELKQEMVARQYEHKGAGAKIAVEPKADYRLRTGKSPDLADAAFVLIEVCRERMGLFGGERYQVNKAKRKQHRNQFNQMDKVFTSTPMNLDLDE